MCETVAFDEKSDVIFNTQKKKSDERELFTDTYKQKPSPELVIASMPIAVGRNRSQTSSRKVTPTPTAISSITAAVEKPLPNGDIFVGSFLGNVPHGSGKYVWKDGCVYQGEWRRGKASGKGKFTWPSGAVYNGDFKSGRMDGFGTFVGSDGDTYRGEWSLNRKHGCGKKKYGNGDLYVGNWKGDVQDGEGRYVWMNGNEYVGEWKNGVIYGRGVLIWANGNRYDGNWENGVPKGDGVFTWPDGSCYVGTWSEDFKMNGTFYPGNGKEYRFEENGPFFEGNLPKRRLSLDVGRRSSIERNLDCLRRSSLDVGRESFNERNMNSPSPSSMDVGTGSLIERNSIFLRRSSLDGGVGSLVERYLTFPKRRSSLDRGTENLVDRNLAFPNRRSSLDCGKGSPVGRYLTFPNRHSALDGGTASPAEKNLNFPRICIWESDGEAGDITCDIVDNVEASMLYWDGVRGFRRKPCCSRGEVKKPGQTISKGHKDYDLMINLQLGIRYSVGKHSSISRDPNPSDFDPREKFWTRFPPEGSKDTPPHESVDFRWKDYCPFVFRKLRQLFQVDPEEYMEAICGKDALRELSSPGKSGSSFYLTQDDRFMIKTVKKSEVKVLIRMLQSYYRHVYRYDNALLTKFFGVHCVKPVGGQKTRFIVMGNLFCSEYRIHRRFDLKGSSHGRTTDKPEEEIDETTTLKDLDLNFVFRLQTKWFQEFGKQIDRDCEFLESERIMDYSLLVGLHFRDDDTCDKVGLSPSGTSDSHPNKKFMDCSLSGRKPLIRLGANLPARAARMSLRSNFELYSSGYGHLTPSQSGDVYEVVLYFGIIDILQDYDISKKLERAYKSLQADPTSISAVDPKLYSKRFRDFIGRIFIEDM